MLPVNIARFAVDITLSAPWECSVIPKEYTIAALSADAYSTAKCSITSGLIPVISEAMSKVYFCITSFISSKPLVLFAMNSSSCKSLSMMTLIIAFIKATSVPVSNCTYSSAILAVGVNLGSNTTNLAPFCLAWINLRPNNGCASMLFDPIQKM